MNDVEYEELGPGKGARITLKGKTLEAVTAAAEGMGIEPEDFILAALEAFCNDQKSMDDLAKEIGG